MSVWPPMSPETLVAGVRPAASLYAAVKSDCALAATASPMPRSPVMLVAPVLVTVAPARTAKPEASQENLGSSPEARVKVAFIQRIFLPLR